MKQKLVLIASLFTLALSATPNARSQWLQIKPYGGTITALAANDSNLFVGTYGGGVFLSTDNGNSWTAASSGLTNTDVYSFAMNDTNHFAGTGSGVFLSTDYGPNWTESLTLPQNTNVQALMVNGTNLFAGIDGGVFLSTNNGTSWTADTIGMGARYVTALAANGSNLFAGTQESFDGGVFLSTDKSSSWTVANAGLTNTDVTALVVIGTYLFAGTNFENASEEGGVFLSTNNGSSWMATGLTEGDVYTLAVSGTNLFAGTYPGGVHLSTDNGASWTAQDTGLANTNITALSASGTYLFVGTDGDGVWRRPLSDFGISSVTQTPPSPPQIQSYPNPFSQSTTVTFSSQSAGFAEVTVVNLLGAEVAQLFSGELSAGEHSFSWDASGFAPGMYECVVRMNGQVQRVSMSLIR
jgi:hypothetical protein